MSCFFENLKTDIKLNVVIKTSNQKEGILRLLGSYYFFPILQ